EGKVLLREWPIEFHVIALVQLHRTHVANDSHNLNRHAAARDEQSLPDWVLVAKYSLRARGANNDHLRVIGNVAVVEVATGEKRNAKGAEPAWCNVIRRRTFALSDRRNITFGACVECGAEAAEKRKAGTDRGILCAR